MVLFGVGRLVETVQTRSENYIFSCFPPEFWCAWRWGPPCCHVPMPVCLVAVTLWQISVLSVTKQKEKQAYVVFLLCFHCTQTALSNQLNDGVQKVRCLFFPQPTAVHSQLFCNSARCSAHQNKSFKACPCAFMVIKSHQEETNYKGHCDIFSWR